jgi:hypothetical protein
MLPHALALGHLSTGTQLADVYRACFFVPCRQGFNKLGFNRAGYDK